MKKLLFVAAAAAGMVAVADVQSANTVGYTQITIKPGLNMIGTSFFKVDDMGRYDINATFSNCKGNCVAGEGEDVADDIMVYDAAKQTYAYNQFFFYAYPEEPDENYDYHWLDSLTGDFREGGFIIPTANGFWYRHRGDKDIVLNASGAVGNEDVQVTLKPGLNMIVNPFPVAFELNDGTINWKEAGVTAGEGEDVADDIMVYDASLQTYAFNQFFFYAYPEEPDENYDYHWLDSLTGDFREGGANVPVGGGFWYRNRGGKDITITIKSPLKK